MDKTIVDKYYHDFLDIDKSKKINNCYYISTTNRNKVLNKEYYYPLIIAKYNNKRYISVSDKHSQEFLKYIKNYDILNLSEKNIYELINNYFKNIFNLFKIKTMYRLYKDKKIKIDNNNSMLLSENTKEYFLNTGKKSINKEYKEKMWNEMKYLIDNDLVYIVPRDKKIVSMAYISDTYNNGANIVVNTDEKYRNLGYGKNTVTMVVNTTIDKKYLPIYFVNKENVSSIKLAESLGFKYISEEIVLCLKKRED